MILRLIILTIFYGGMNMTVATEKPDYFAEMNGDMPSNFREIMPVEISQSAELSSEKRFDEAVEILKELYKNKKFDSKRARTELEKIYIDAENKFPTVQGQFDPAVTLKDYIRNDTLRYFWLWYYYPYDEGLVVEDEE